MPLFQARRPYFRANKGGTNQTGIPVTTFTKVTFNTEVADVGGYFDAATNSRWTPPAGGVLLAFSLHFGAGNADGLRLGSIFKNGVELARFGGGTKFTASDGTVSGSVVDVASGTDYYEVFAYSDVGSGIVIGTVAETFFSGSAI